MVKKVISIVMKVLATVVFLYTFLGFVILPYLIQTNFSKAIKTQIGANGYLEKVYINPYSFEVELTNLLIQDNTNKTLVYFKKLSLDFEFLSLFKDILVVKQISMQNLKSNIIIDKNQITNFQFILDFLNKNQISGNDKEVKSTQIIPIQIDDINIIKSRVSFVDNTKSTPFKVNTKAFDINLRNISTLHNKRGKLELFIEAKDTLKLKINSDISLNPIKFDGVVSLENISIPKLHSYIQDDIKFNLDGNRVDIDLEYQVDMKDDILNVDINNLTTLIPNIKYKTKELSVNLHRIRNTINSISLNKSNDDLILNIDDILLKNTSLKFTDLTKKEPINLTIKNINCGLKTMTLDKSLPIKFNLSLDTQHKGTIATSGDVIVEPLMVTTKLNVDSLSLKPYLPYLKDIVNIDLKSGYLNTKSDIKLTKKDNIFYPKVNANISLDDIDIYHKLTAQRVLLLKQLVIEKLIYTNDNLNITHLLIDSASSKFAIAKDKTTNFDNIIPVNRNTKKSIPKDKKRSKFNYFVEKLEIKDTKLNFSDLSLPLPFRTDIHSLTANIQAISSNDISTKIVLNGMVDKYGLAKIKGAVNTVDFKKKSDISVNFENLDLISVSPYSGKFIGNKISNGKLWLDLDYKIKDSNLTSFNNIRIKDLELGDKVESNESVSLPIGLAIALLENSDGFIDVDVPVSGDINNPEFKLGGAIWGAVGNIITNIVTAPFRFLASLLGLSSDELGSIDFEYGSVGLLAPQVEILDKLVKALNKKPNLALLLKPVYDEVNDKKVLQEKKFLKLTNKKDKEKIITKLYIDNFGEEKYKKLKNDTKKEKLIDTLSFELIQVMVVEKVTLEQLALNRAREIKTYLESKELDEIRIVIDNSIELSNDLDKKRITMNLDIEIKK